MIFIYSVFLLDILFIYLLFLVNVIIYLLYYHWISILFNKHTSPQKMEKLNIVQAWSEPPPGRRGRDVSRCDICVISDRHIINKNT